MKFSMRNSQLTFLVKFDLKFEILREAASFEVQGKSTSAYCKEKQDAATSLMLLQSSAMNEADERAHISYVCAFHRFPSHFGCLIARVKHQKCPESCPNRVASQIPSPARKMKNSRWRTENPCEFHREKHRKCPQSCPFKKLGNTHEREE